MLGLFVDHYITLQELKKTLVKRFSYDGMAVSYTHLDVYKRQILRIDSSIRNYTNLKIFVNIVKNQ